MNTLITGAADGLGAALCVEAVNHGGRVIGIDNNWQSSIFGAENGNVQIEADLSDIEALIPLTRTIMAQGPYSTIIHNAATSATGSFEDIPAEAHQRLLDINVTAPLILTQRLLESDMIKKGGTLIFIASLSVYTGYPGAASYATSKATIANYAKSLRKALHPKGIQLLVVYPGPIKTEQARRHAPQGANEEKRMSASKVAGLIWRAAEKKQKTLIPGKTNLVGAIMGILAPRVLDRLMKKIIYDKLNRPIY